MHTGFTVSAEIILPAAISIRKLDKNSNRFLYNSQAQTFTLNKNEGNLLLRRHHGQAGVDDLTKLEDLHEASVLWNLRSRYDISQFYTYIGSILISVNPYMMHPDLYGLEMAKKYVGTVLGMRFVLNLIGVIQIFHS